MSFSLHNQNPGKGDPLIQCLAKNLPLLDPIVVPSTELFKEASVPYNTRLQSSVRPLAIVYPSAPSSISKAIICASQLSHPVIARSGGHSYGAYSLGGSLSSSSSPSSNSKAAEPSLILDLRAFRNLQYDPVHQTLEVGSGILLGEMNEFLEKNGRAIPSGSCPTVGVGGQVLAGGFGLTSRAWGLLLDNLISVDAVLASGEEVHASPEVNPDLFWALAGAGPSFAIAHTFRFRTHPKPKSITYFELTLLPRALPFTPEAVSRSANLFQAFQAFGETNDAVKELGMAWHVTPEPGMRGQMGTKVEIIGQFIDGAADGNKFEEASEALKRFIQDTGESDFSLDYRTMTYLDSMHNVGGNWTRLEDRGRWNINEHVNFYAKSLITKKDIPDRAMTAHLAYLLELASHPVPSSQPEWFVLSPFLGGATQSTVVNPQKIQNIQHNSKSNMAGQTSFAHRDLKIVWELYAKLKEGQAEDGVWTHQKGEGSLVNFVTKMAEDLGEVEAVYPAYVDPELSATDYPRLVFGNNYPELVNQKMKWDPTNVFRYPQSIRASSSGSTFSPRTLLSVAIIAALAFGASWSYKRRFVIRNQYLRWRRKGSGTKVQVTKLRTLAFALLAVAIWILFVIGRSSHMSLFPSGTPPSGPTKLIVTTPQNSSYPLHQLSLESYSLFQPTALSMAADTLSDKRFLTNIAKHPTTRSILFAVDEQESGGVYSLDVGSSSNPESVVTSLGRRSTFGKEPAYVHSSGSDGWIATGNYGSGSMSFHAVDLRGGFQDEEVSRIDFQTRTSHPHQVIPHPSKPDLLYIPDLAANNIRILRLNRVFGDPQWSGKEDFPIPAQYGSGPRHGVITRDGSHLFLALQDSSTIVSIPLEADTGKLLPIVATSVSTLPPSFDANSFALSAITLSESGKWLFVANRRVKGPFPSPGAGGDTIAVFKVVPMGKGSMLGFIPKGHIDTGCSQPREMKQFRSAGLSGSPTQYLAVSCVGVENSGTGVVLLKIDEKTGSGSMVKSWVQESSWGLELL